MTAPPNPRRADRWSAAPGTAADQCRLWLGLQPTNGRLWLALQPTNGRLWLALQPTNGRLYGAITWSAITPLSEQSIANSVQTLEFPDFTAGLWKQRKPMFAFDGTY